MHIKKYTTQLLELISYAKRDIDLELEVLVKSAINRYWINSASLTISLEAIREYTVKEKRIINITRSIVAENLLKYFDIKTI